MIGDNPLETRQLLSPRTMPDDTPPRSEIVLYQTVDGRTRIQCRFAHETIWLTQRLISELF